jgi:hypothetical protein
MNETSPIDSLPLPQAIAWYTKQVADAAKRRDYSDMTHQRLMTLKKRLHERIERERRCCQ